ncbi:MAG: hypothetical protein U9N59_00065 [Campylobacterota bacterium]|nr:hypothetical protein [Campylobacterota bacterium]
MKMNNFDTQQQTTILGLSTLIFFASGQSLILQPMAVALGFVST